MSLTVTSGPSSTDLTTKAEVKEELEITSTDDDQLFDDLIARASEAINRELGRGRDGLAEQTYEEQLGAHGDPYLTVSRTPVTNVASVTRDGEAVTDVEIHDAEAGLLYRKDGFRSTEAATTHLGPAIRQPHEAHPDYTVTYTAGWVMPGASGRTLPHDLEKAAIETVKAWYKARDRDPDVASVALGDAQVDFRNDEKRRQALPASALELLAPFRRVA